MSKDIKISSHDISDILIDKIVPIEGSIKIDRIDGMLVSKQKYIEGLWKNICRYPECTLEPKDKTGLCTMHYEEQVKNNINTEKMYRTTNNIDRDISRYMWSSKHKEYQLLCSTYMCSKLASRKDIKSDNYYKCKEHSSTSTTSYSSQQNTVNIFNEIKNDMLIAKIKVKKTKNKDNKDNKDKESVEPVL